MQQWLQGFLNRAKLARRVNMVRSVGLVAGSAAIIAVLSLPFLG